jgi:MerR family transcriptional regulator, light-induced transcriptional regulator
MDSRLASSWSFLEEGDFAPTEIERMAHACLKSLEAALLQIEQWRQDGRGLEDIYIHGLAPSARLLGHWWCCDIADFAQVTIGASNLQRVLHRLSPEFCAPGADSPRKLSLLLATEPGSQHTMGAFMLAEFFRRHGWSVQLLTPHDGDEVLNHLHRDWFDAVALSVSSDRQLQVLAQWLPQLRALAPNPQLHVLVGGPMTLQAPQALQALGVDLMACDARQTVNWLSQQVMHRKS